MVLKKILGIIRLCLTFEISVTGPWFFYKLLRSKDKYNYKLSTYGTNIKALLRTISIYCTEKSSNSSVLTTI